MKINSLSLFFRSDEAHFVSFTKSKRKEKRDETE